ncbi:MAG: nucleotidyltransferase family protein [Defluviitaleaceae bacterium]|nr:nucleotidyltransferase family protein [Defluviitaleaceae bacterium]MCL2275972.1 nucleotidyltransferase family protein [Defluviitaleaceae bacterium]
MTKKKFSTAGIIVEFNPLHNGHKAHIDETRRITGCENIIAVMSGNYVQRGEPALINKWRRTKMALQAGVDLVIELPLPYVLSGADYFARGAVHLLEATGLVDCLCFGSESGDIEAIKTGARVLATEPLAYKEALRKALDAGRSFAAARGAALEAALGLECTGLTTLPNNGLGMEYCKALELLGNPFPALTTHRIAGGPSATAIRAKKRGLYYTDNTVPEMPPYAHESLKAAILQDEAVQLDDFSDMFRYVLFKENTTHPLMGEGLYNRFRKYAHAFARLSDLISAVKTKRYTRTRLQRAVMCAVLGVTPPTLLPAYVRVLGFRKEAAFLMGALTRSARLPVLSHANAVKAFLLEGGTPAQMLKKEWQAGEIYRLAHRGITAPEREAPIVRF